MSLCPPWLAIHAANRRDFLPLAYNIIGWIACCSYSDYPHPLLLMLRGAAIPVWTLLGLHTARQRRDRQCPPSTTACGQITAGTDSSRETGLSGTAAPLMAAAGRSGGDAEVDEPQDPTTAQEVSPIAGGGADGDHHSLLWALAHLIPLVWIHYAITRRTLWPYALILSTTLLARHGQILAGLDDTAALMLSLPLVPAAAWIGIHLATRRKGGRPAVTAEQPPPSPDAEQLSCAEAAA